MKLRGFAVSETVGILFQETRADAFHIAAIAHRANDGNELLLSLLKIPASVLPNNLIAVWLVPFWPATQDHE